MRASVIVLAHGPEPHLVECVQAACQQVSEVVVVDNDAAPGPVAAVSVLPDVMVLRPGRNLGYAGGCNFAAGHSAGDVLVFLNSDAVPAAGSVAALCDRLRDPRVGLACASIRLADQLDLVNSAGNPVHFLMFSWAGAFGQPASRHALPSQVASVSGVMFAVRRDVWDELGGFDPAYFAYCEDTYLSLRAWQAGYWVIHEPAAVAAHHYEVARNPRKRYLLERNRLINLLVLPEARTCAVVAPAALLVEAGVLLAAVRQGWAGDKVAGWRWLIANGGLLRRRRAEVQRTRRVADREMSLLMRGPLDPPKELAMAVPDLVSRALARYWHWAVIRL